VSAALHVVVDHRFQPPSPGWEEHLAAQVSYLEHEGTALFTAGDSLDRAQGRALLRAWAGRHAAFHRLILSLSAHSGLVSPAEVTLWTRTLVDRLGDRLQRDLVYVGAAHRGKGMLHSHVLLGGSAPLQGTARRTEVLLRLDDCAWLREQGTQSAQAQARRSDEARAALAQYTRTYRQGERA